MRKSTKALWIAFGIFMLSGGIFICVGAASSADFSLVKGRFWAFGDNNADFARDFDMENFELSENFEDEEIDSVSMDINCSVVKVVISEDDKCRLYVDEDYSRMIEAELDNGSLHVFDDDSEYFSRWFWRRHRRYGRAILEIPKKVYDNFTVTVDTGAVQLPDIEADQMDLSADVGYIESPGGCVQKINGFLTAKADVGYITLDKVISKDCSLDVDTGSIDISKIETVNFTGNCDLGNIEIGFLDAEDSELDCDMGNITVRFAGGLHNYSITKNNDMGNVDISGHERGSDRGARKINIDCDMGNITVDFED